MTEQKSLHRPCRAVWTVLITIALGSAALGSLQARLLQAIPVNSNDAQTEHIRPIYVDSLAPDYGLGINTSEGRTDWIAVEDGVICMAYPSGQVWGALFITVGEPTQSPRPSQDFSSFDTLSVELRGAVGGETVLVGIKDRNDADDGTETKIAVTDLSQEWQTYKFSLASFETADLSQLYVVVEFVFEGSAAATVCFRNIKYLGPTEVATETSVLPDEFVLQGAFPNPFNPSVTVRFDMPEAGEVTLFVFDVLGHAVERIDASGLVAAGRHREIRFEAGSLASGTYFYRLEMRTSRQRVSRVGSFTLVR